MASFEYTPMKTRRGRGQLNMETADLRALVVTVGTNAHTLNDAANLAAITTLSEYAGTGYARTTLASKTVIENLANDRADFDCADLNFGSAVSAAATNIAGVIILDRVDGTAANDRPWLFIDFAAANTNGGGGPLDMTVNAGGLAQLP